MGIIWRFCVRIGLLNFGVLKIGVLYRACVLFWRFVSRMYFILAATSIKRLNMPLRYMLK